MRLQRKYVKAVAPYHHPGFLNFKEEPYLTWKALGGKVAKAHYPWRWLHGLVYRWGLPSMKIFKSKIEARLCFVEPVSISFDTFPNYTRYEIIPMVWDCWPQHFEKMCTWLKKYNVRTAIFTSSQTAERIKERSPKMNVMFCPEGIDTSKYIAGKTLQERSIDLLEFGRSTLNININGNENGNGNKEQIRYVCTKMNGKFQFSSEQLTETMGDAKITIALPRSVTDPKMAGDIETLTQRYWECMLSRMIMVGQAPMELTDLIGYDPVIAMDRENSIEQIKDMLMHIDDYQPLVDKNRETALRLGDWSLRINQVMDWLQKCEYSV